MEIIACTNEAIILRIDTRLYSETVLFKTLYWLGEEILFSVIKDPEGFLIVNLTHVTGSFEADGSRKLISQVSRGLIDFKVRDIVNRETSDIRKMIIAKAFLDDESFFTEDNDLMKTKN